ncbi:MAG: NAD(P)/FAD-dependent oxidoreductase [Bacteroidales bacterium]|nr:NAD(P)/FAD-dependent oxidoreductase [Bacteroidales bacterium]
MKKSCIIIGSGLGGLSCGVILSKNGYKVTVIEQGNQIGGCLQCFYRKGIKFETGMHFIGSADKDQTLYKLMNLLELTNNINLHRLNTNAYDTVSFNGELFNFANGKEAFIEQMSSYFPKETDNINKYYSLVEQIAEASSLHSLRQADSDYVINTIYQTSSINEVLESITNNKILQSVLVGNLPLYAAEKDKTPFASHAFIMDFYNKSAFRVINGSDSIATSLSQTIKRYGGEVITNQKAVKILCNEEKATGIITANGELYNADYIISSIHPTRTVELLKETKLLRPAFKNRMQNLRNTISGFTIYLHFKKDSVPYMNSNFYKYSSADPWDCENYTYETWPKGYLYMHMCHENNPKYAESAVILSYMSIDEVSKWSDTNVEHRGEEYKKFKEEKAKKLLSKLEEDFPGINKCIENYYTSSPLTYRDYTGTEGGSMYGVAKDVTLTVSNRVPHKTKIPNLLLTGQNINSHGMLGVIVGAIVTCSELLTAERIYKQIVESNK